MEPLLKYPGGKRRLSSFLKDKIGDLKDQRYIELFAGGAAVFFKIQPERAVLVDINKPLMSFYEAVKREPVLLFDELQRLRSLPFTPETYYSIREEWDGNDFGAKFAAKLLYLNKTCFNGLMRLNQELKFNASWGKKKVMPEMPSMDELMLASKLLQDTKLYVGDFMDILKATHKGDVVYADPPYWDTFDRYAGKAFDNDDHRRLAAGLKSAAERGVSIFASNLDCVGVRELYAEWANIESISMLHKIGCTTESRKTVNEVLIYARGKLESPLQVEMFG